MYEYIKLKIFYNFFVIVVVCNIFVFHIKFKLSVFCYIVSVVLCVAEICSFNLIRIVYNKTHLEKNAVNVGRIMTYCSLFRCKSRMGNIFDFLVWVTTMLHVLFNGIFFPPQDIVSADGRQWMHELMKHTALRCLCHNFCNIGVLLRVEAWPF